MKISLNWLGRYVDLDGEHQSPEKLAEQLALCGGLEVDEIHRPGLAFEKVVTGVILEKLKHPSADRLSVCQVSTGHGVVHQIVCGAKNHNQGDKVVVALPGAILPGNFQIKKTTIRGVDSCGMLCSSSELGLNSGSSPELADGILILPSDAAIGTEYADYLGVRDVIFEVKVTPNRSDCLSHFGLAREIAVLTGRICEFPVESFLLDEQSCRSQIKVIVTDHQRCLRYSGICILGVQVGPSPAWLRQSLEAVGLKSVNNVVDATNFVMLELGQPLHSFDISKINGKVEVGSSQKGEKFETLDGTILELTGDELVIRDDNAPIALAGVVGGKNSGINENTTDLFIESALFSSASVRRTSRRFGIETDASYRFSRGVDPEGVLLALNHCSQMIQKIAGGRILREAYDIYSQPIKKPTIELDNAFVNQKIGFEISPVETLAILRRIGCEINDGEVISGQDGNDELPGRFCVKPPSYRWDLRIPEDLVEEVARLKGYPFIPETLSWLKNPPKSHHPEYDLRKRWVNMATGQGFRQTIHYSFVSSQDQNEFLGNLEFLNQCGIIDSHSAVTIKNPLSEAQNVMRLSLGWGLFTTAIHNDRFGQKSGEIFEVGETFSHQVRMTNDSDSVTDPFNEALLLGLCVWGSPIDLWNQKMPPAVYRIKSALENMVRQSQLGQLHFQSIPNDQLAGFLHPQQATLLSCLGTPVGYLGTLHPVVCERYKLRVDCAIAEVNLYKLNKILTRKMVPISKFPVMQRDLAFVMPLELPVGEVVAEIQRVAGNSLREVCVFDVYQGEGLALGSRSVGFRMKFQNLEKTLTDTEIQKVQDEIVSFLAQKFSISLRS